MQDSHSSDLKASAARVASAAANPGAFSKACRYQELPGFGLVPLVQP